MRKVRFIRMKRFASRKKRKNNHVGQCSHQNYYSQEFNEIEERVYILNC